MASRGIEGAEGIDGVEGETKSAGHHFKGATSRVPLQGCHFKGTFAFLPRDLPAECSACRAHVRSRLGRVWVPKILPRYPESRDLPELTCVSGGRPMCQAAAGPAGLLAFNRLLVLRRLVSRSVLPQVPRDQPACPSGHKHAQKIPRQALPEEWLSPEPDRYGCDQREEESQRKFQRVGIFFHWLAPNCSCPLA